MSLNYSEYVPKRALAILSHLDDVEFLIGGTIAKWTSLSCGFPLHSVYKWEYGVQMGSIDPDRLAMIRREEQEKARKVLNVKFIEFLEFNDCELQPTLNFCNHSVAKIRKYKPEVLIMCDDPEVLFFDEELLPGAENIIHSGHRTVSISAIITVFSCSYLPGLWPSFGKQQKVDFLYLRTNRLVNICIDISETKDRKILGLLQHKSQFHNWNPSEPIRKWASPEKKGEKFSYAEMYRRIEIN